MIPWEPSISYDHSITFFLRSKVKRKVWSTWVHRRKLKPWTRLMLVVINSLLDQVIMNLNSWLPLKPLLLLLDIMLELNLKRTLLCLVLAPMTLIDVNSSSHSMAVLELIQVALQRFQKLRGYLLILQIKNIPCLDLVSTLIIWMAYQSHHLKSSKNWYIDGWLF